MPAVVVGGMGDLVAVGGTDLPACEFGKDGKRIIHGAQARQLLGGACQEIRPISLLFTPARKVTPLSIMKSIRTLT